MRRSTIFALFRPALGLALLSASAVPSLTAETRQQVFVPAFIDPGHHTEKPDLGGTRVIRFLTADDYPPFNFTGPDGAPAGFNVDLARAICDELKVACSIQARGWDTLVAALQSNAGDAIAASLAITAQSRADLEFSMPTMTTPARFAARDTTAVAGVLPETLGARHVGVQVGTAHEAYLKAFFPAAGVRTYTDPDSLRAALKAGEIDLMFADGLSTALWLNGTGAGGCCRFVGGPFTESRYFGDGTGLAVRKGDILLRHAFDYALERLQARGVTADLYLKYFPVGFF